MSINALQKRYHIPKIFLANISVFYLDVKTLNKANSFEIILVRRFSTIRRTLPHLHVKSKWRQTLKKYLWFTWQDPHSKFSSSLQTAIMCLFFCFVEHETVVVLAVKSTGWGHSLKQNLWSGLTSSQRLFFLAFAFLSASNTIRKCSKIFVTSIQPWRLFVILEYSQASWCDGKMKI